MRIRHISGIVSVLFLSGISLPAQEVITSSGGSITGGEGSVNYSVGQVFHETFSSADGMLSHGVQQPYEILTEIGDEGIAWISLSVSAYPNPVKDILVLSTECDDYSDLVYQLFDMNGKQIENKGLDGEKMNIDMHGLGPSAYILKVVKSNKEIKTFIIIKN
ncbi:MAG: T9SS type A sorting domain-containing protein [Bacteroidota bacterium]